MKILAIDTTTEACSVALLGPDGLIERFQVAPREHTSLVLPWVSEVLEEGGVSLPELDAIAVTRGPGSFTGVRIGISVAQGLAAGAGLGLVGVSTLHAMALSVHQQAGVDRVLAALDARMDEIYCAGFDFSGSDPLLVEEQVCAPADWQVGGDGWLGAGPGFERYPQLITTLGDSLSGVFEHAVLPRAAMVAQLARQYLADGHEVLPPERLQPTYLRNRVASKPRS
jgi:tRNA threonylcarbamoyladenosine biosynthesis protein TsaB